MPVTAEGGSDRRRQMFQPNSPQWVTIVVTFVFATAATSDSTQVAAFFVITGALIVWWLEGRRQKRNELQQRTRRQSEADTEAADSDISPIVAKGSLGLTDVSKAHIDSLRKAADQGLASAQFNLGAMYADGQGVPQDYAEAHKWMNLAASRATGAQQKRSVEFRDGLAKKMALQQLADASPTADPGHGAHSAWVRLVIEHEPVVRNPRDPLAIPVQAPPQHRIQILRINAGWQKVGADRAHGHPTVEDFLRPLDQ